MNRNEKKNIGDSEKKQKKYRFYKFIAITVLVVFLIGGLVIFENDITMENLRYLVKYLDFSSSGAFSDGSVIYYNADSANRFHVFRGDLALVNSSGVSLYDRRGSVVMSDSYSMASPTSVCGDRYLVIYDMGGHQVRLYNSFSLLYDKSFSYPVQSVSINKDGSFCVVTSQKNYHSAVYVYDNDFKEIHKWLSADKFAVEAHLSDQNILSISAVHVENGDLVSDLVRLEIGKKDGKNILSVKDELPLAHKSDKKGTVFFTDRALRYVTKDAKVQQDTKFPEESLEKIVIGDEISAVLQDELSVGVSYRLRIFDSKGSELRSHKFSSTVRDIQIWEDTVYVLTNTELVVLAEGEDVYTEQLDGDYSAFGVLSQKQIILCSDTEAHIRVLDF